MTSDTPPTTIDRIAKHILSHLHPSTGTHPRAQPLFVALQGPQGSGKTYITSLLAQHLTSIPHNLKLATLSLDDLYLPHTKLLDLKERQYPGNRLLEGRGLPGTHDLELAIDVLGRLKNINEGNSDDEVLLPVFDKSVHNGEGDRLPPNPDLAIHGPLDIVILEGWCLGFSSIDSSSLQERWEGMSEEMKGWCRLGHVKEVNGLLEAYEKLWALFDVFVQIKPPNPAPDVSPYAIIYKWRLEQEHYMKSHNEGKGMSDAQVVSFVDRYIPGYIFFSDGIVRGSSTSGSQTDTGDSLRRPPKWIGKSLRITIGEERQYVGEEVF